MSLLRIQRVLWIPLQRQHLIASLLSALAMIGLGAIGFAGFPAFKAYADIQATTRSTIYFNIALFGANYLFLIRQALPSYLRPRRALMPTLLSLLALCAASFALTLWLGPTPAPSAAANSAASSAVAAARWENFLRALLIAQGGLSAVILTSGLWKNDEESIAVLARSLAKLRDIRQQLSSGVSGIEVARKLKRVLIFHLETIQEWIEKNQYLVELVHPEQLAKLKKDCDAALSETENLDPGEFCDCQIGSWVRRRLDPIADFA